MEKLVHLTNIISLNTIGYIILLPVVLFWIWGILYVTRDISHRTENILYEIFSILLAFILGPIGLLLYLVIRPYHTIYEKKLLENLITKTQECSECGTINNENNKHCIGCGEKLKVECKECKKEYYNQYEYCPHCGAPNLDL